MKKNYRWIRSTDHGELKNKRLGQNHLSPNKLILPVFLIYIFYVFFIKEHASPIPIIFFFASIWDSLVDAFKTAGNAVADVVDTVADTIISVGKKVIDWHVDNILIPVKDFFWGKVIKPAYNFFKSNFIKLRDYLISNPWIRNTLVIGAVILGILITPDLYNNLVQAVPPPPPIYTNTSVPTATSTSTPTATPTSTTTATRPPTRTPTPTKLACLYPIQPANNAEFRSIGRWEWRWNPQPGAAYYSLVFIGPDGKEALNMITDQLVQGIYLESIPTGGSYSWYIIAWDSNDNQICRTGSYNFNKTQFVSPTPSQPVAGGQGSGGSSGGSCASDDFDCDGVKDDVDICPSDGDKGKGVDADGCPNY